LFAIARLDGEGGIIVPEVVGGVRLPDEEGEESSEFCVD